MGQLASGFVKFMAKAILFSVLLFNMSHFAFAAPTWGTSASNIVNRGASSVRIDIDGDGTTDASVSLTTSVNNNNLWVGHSSAVNVSNNHFAFTYYAKHNQRSDAPYLYQSIQSSSVSTSGSNLDMSGVSFQPILSVASGNDLKHWDMTWSPSQIVDAIVNSPLQPDPSNIRRTQVNSAGVLRRIRPDSTASCARLPASSTFSFRSRHYYFFKKVATNSDNAKVGGERIYATFQMPVDLSVRKVNSGVNQDMVPGEVGYYDLYLTNSATAKSAGVNIKLTDDWSNASGLEFVRAEEISAIGRAGSYSVSGTTGRWEIPNIQIGETRQMRVYFRVKTTASAGSYSTTISTTADMPNVQQDTVANTCSTSPSGWNALKVSASESQTSTVTVLTPSATLEKTATFYKGSDNLGSVGDLIRYKFKVLNTGDVPIDIALSEAAFSGGGAMPSPTFNVSESSNASATSVGVGGTAIFYADYATTEADFLAQQAGTPVTNTASLSFTAQDADGVIDTANTIPTHETTHSASVAIPIPTALATVRKSVKSGTGIVVNAGDKITYLFEVENTGQAPLANVKPLDFGPKVDGTTATGSMGALRVTSGIDADGDGDVDVLNAGETAQFEVDFTVSAQDIVAAKAAADPLTAITNTASAVANAPVGVPDTTITDAVAITAGVAVPELTTTKTVDGTPTLSWAGDVLTYLVEVENSGNVALTDVGLTDDGPTIDGFASNGTVAISLETVDGVAVSAADKADVDVDSLAAGGKAVFKVVYTLSASDQLAASVAASVSNVFVNTATARGTYTAGSNSANPQAAGSVAYGFTPDPSWTLDKTTSSTPREAGDTLSYSFSLSNTGNVALSSISLIDAKCASGPTLVVSSDMGADAVVFWPR